VSAAAAAAGGCEPGTSHCQSGLSLLLHAPQRKRSSFNPLPPHLPPPTPPPHTPRHASVLAYYLILIHNSSGRIAQIAGCPCIMDALVDQMMNFLPDAPTLSGLAVKCVHIMCEERAGAEAVLRAHGNEGFEVVAGCLVGFRFPNPMPGHPMAVVLEAQYKDAKAGFLEILQALTRAAPQRVMLRAMRVPGFLEKIGEFLETDTPYVRASAVKVRRCEPVL